jgi:catechol 2,3-dioxygenase-like lactoylglutathione lyase family enzyme
MQNSGLNHVLLTITQVERSRTFYRDLLGFDTTDMSGGGFDGFSFQSGGVAFFLNAGQVILGDRFKALR